MEIDARIVTITTQTFDADAGLRLRLLDDGGIGDRSRRATITRTLDGGVVVDDLGSFDSDREIVVRAQVNAAERQRIQNLHVNNSLIRIGTAEGMFSAVSLTLIFASGEVTWTLRVTERLDV